MKKTSWAVLVFGIIVMVQSSAIFTPQAASYESGLASEKSRPANQEHTTNRYEVAGITNPAAFEAFFAKLQDAVKKDDAKEVAKYVRYPLRVNKDGKSRFIQDEQQFLEEYDRIITGKVKEALLHQKIADAFVNDQGVMVGNGEMWLGEYSKRYVVFAINVE